VPEARKRSCLSRYDTSSGVEGRQCDDAISSKGFLNWQSFGRSRRERSIARVSLLVCGRESARLLKMAFLFLFFTVALSLCVVGLIVIALAAILGRLRDDWKLKKPERGPPPGDY
jgi:hypothetical protein